MPRSGVRDRCHTQHGFIADMSGDAAILEFPAGNTTLIHPVMTNHFQV